MYEGLAKRVTRVAALCSLWACSQSVHSVNSPDASLCGPCVSTFDCPGNEVCTASAIGGVCTLPCITVSDCAAGERCLEGRTVEGTTTEICLTEDGICPGSEQGVTDGGPGPDVDGGGETDDSGIAQPEPDSGEPTSGDAGESSEPDAGSTGYCEGLAGPGVADTCCPCTERNGNCAANNCYNGWYCDPTNCRCVSPPANCPGGRDAGSSSRDAGTSGRDAGTSRRDAGMVEEDAGVSSSGLPPGPVTSTIDPHDGGTESTLYFAVIGDTRPANIDDTPNYPTAIITKIFQDVEALSPRPPFVIGTGDYQFTSLTGGEQQTQLGYYQAARQLYSGVYWPAMGNHECDGYTNSNCGPGSSYPTPTVTANFTVWAGLFLQPIGESAPNYVRNVKAPDNSWTAKFIFAAPNYWNPSTQPQWFSSALAASSTYTFVIHHEDKGAPSAPASLSGIESAESGHETLSIVGHNHLWQHTSGSAQVIIGNGGAPLNASGQTYGYTLVTRQSDGSILVTAYDYETNAPLQQFSVP